MLRELFGELKGLVVFPFWFAWCLIKIGFAGIILIIAIHFLFKLIMLLP